MRYAGILKNDFVNGIGVCVSFWTQGCPFHCPGCHNPKTWDFNGGLEDTEEHIMQEVCDAINVNGVHRNLSILGGEPLCAENAEFVMKLICRVKQENPDIKVFLWTGYTLDELKQQQHPIFNLVDVLVTGRFVLALRDITVKWTGSSNQQVCYKGIDF